MTGVSMPQPGLTCLAALAYGVVCLCVSPLPAHAQSALKMIDNPGGGHVVYGPVDETTPPAAMVAVLRYVHTRFGESPTVSKIFQSRDGQNFGAFFTVTAKSLGDKNISGLVMVFIARETAPAAAVLYDDSNRFATTEPVLMRMLTDAWRKAS